MPPVTTYYAIGAAGMALGTLAFLRAFLTDRRNRTYHALLTAIAGIALLAYVCMAAGIGRILVDGRPVQLARYGQWILATPLIVLYLGLLAGIDRRRIAVLVVLDVLVMAAGLAGELLTGQLRYIAFVAGSVLYVPLLYGLTRGITGAVADRPAPVRSLFTKLRNLTVIIWTFYPVLWLLGPPGVGVISPTIEVLLITYADVIAKIGFGLIALNSQRSLARLPELDALRLFGTAGTDGGGATPDGPSPPESG